MREPASVNKVEELPDINLRSLHAQTHMPIYTHTHHTHMHTPPPCKYENGKRKKKLLMKSSLYFTNEIMYWLNFLIFCGPKEDR